MNSIIIKEEINNKAKAYNVFLPTGKTWSSTENQKLSVWESGRDELLFKRIITLIKQAKDFICLQSFLIQDTQIIDALVESAIKGVRIFVMDSAEARLKDNGYEEQERYSTTDYKKMINTKFRNRFVHRQASNFHAKFILIDPKTTSKGVMFTGNFNKKPFKENPELGIELSKKQVEDLFKLFVYHFWEFATDEQFEKEQFTKVQPIQKFKAPALQEVLVTSPNSKLSNLKNSILDEISKATQSILFSTFGFDINNDVSKAILDKLKNGVPVTVFCKPREKAISKNIEILAANGASIFCQDLLHAKSIIIDAKWAAIFSANFEKYGMDESFEVGVVLSGKQKDDLLKIYQLWEANFPYEFYNEKSFSSIPIQYAQLKEGKLKTFAVLGQEEQPVLRKTIENLNELINFVEKDIEPKSSKAKKIIQQKEIKFKMLNQTDFLRVKSIANKVDLVEYKEVITKKKTKKEITHEVLLFDNNLENIEDVIAELKAANLKNYKIYMS